MMEGGGEVENSEEQQAHYDSDGTELASWDGCALESRETTLSYEEARRDRAPSTSQSTLTAVQ